MAEIQSFIFLSILAFVSIPILRSIFTRATGKNATFRLPPSPPSLPIIGHLHLLSPALYKSLRHLSDRYGPLLYLRLGAARCLVVSSASMATEIFKTHDAAFASRPIFAFADKLTYGTSGFITAPYGDYWRFMKKLCVTELLGPRQLERSRIVRREEILRLLSRVVARSRENEVVNVGAELMRLTNNVTCRMVMSTACSGGNDEAEIIRDLVKESFEVAAKICFGDVLGPLKKLGFWIYGKKAIELSKSFDELMEKILKEHEERENDGQNPKDLMDILLQIYKDERAELRITRTHIKAFIMDLFIAGTDTSAEAMQWAMAELINHPKALKKLREEIESVAGKSRLVEEDDIPKLPFLQAIMKETLRLYPPGPVTTRECRRSCKIRGFDIPEKTAVAINLYAIMRDPELWNEPDDFRPERFLGSSEEMERRGHSFEFVPFGGGRRGCPGSALAFSLMNTTMAALVQCFDWKLVEDGSTAAEAKLDMRPGQGLSLGMANSLLIVPILRFDPFSSFNGI